MSHTQVTNLEYCVKRQVYVLGVPSHFLMEYRHEVAVVSQEHRMFSWGMYGYQ